MAAPTHQDGRQSTTGSLNAEVVLNDGETMLGALPFDTGGITKMAAESADNTFTMPDAERIKTSRSEPWAR